MRYQARLQKPQSIIQAARRKISGAGKQHASAAPSKYTAWRILSRRYTPRQSTAIALIRVAKALCPPGVREPAHLPIKPAT